MNENKNYNESAVRRIASTTATDIRLLVLDIDGTIADESNRLRESVSRAIGSAKRRGVAVAIATGRLYQNSLHAHDFIGSTLPLICYEGALIREPKTEIVHRHWPLETRAVARAAGPYGATKPERPRIPPILYSARSVYFESE